MRFTLPFLIGLAVFAASTLGANLTSFRPNDDLLFDILLAADSIAYRLENGFGMNETAALPIGGFLLALPAILAFHLFRMICGGSAVKLRAEGRDQARVEQPSQFDDLLRKSSPLPGRDADEIQTRAQQSAQQRRTEPNRPTAAQDDQDFADVSVRPVADNDSSLASRLNIDELDDAALDDLTRPERTGAGEGRGRNWTKSILERKPDLSALKSGLKGFRKRGGGSGET